MHQINQDRFVDNAILMLFYPKLAL